MKAKITLQDGYAREYDINPDGTIDIGLNSVPVSEAKQFLANIGITATVKIEDEAAANYGEGHNSLQELWIRHQSNLNRTNKILPSPFAKAAAPSSIEEVGA